jgi:hypothetical protein
MGSNDVQLCVPADGPALRAVPPLNTALGVQMMTGDEHDALGWRQLGFWYDYSPEIGWVIRGSIEGLQRFVSLLHAYTANPKNRQVSEHEHFGPFMYLKVVTFPNAEVNNDGIYGTLEDIARFAELLEARLRSAPVGAHFELSREFAVRSSTAFTVHVEADSFDPAAYDTRPVE